MPVGIEFKFIGAAGPKETASSSPGLTMSVNSEYWIGDVFGAAGFLILLGFIFGGMYFFVVQREKAYVLLGLEKEKTEALLRRIEKDLSQAATITISSPSTPTGWAWSGTGTGRIIPKKDFAIWSQAVETSRPPVSAGRSSRMSIPSPRPGSHATISPSWS